VLVLKLAWNRSDTQGELVFSSAVASRPLAQTIQFVTGRRKPIRDLEPT